MNYRPLGKTGLHVSPICIGTMNFGTPVDEAGAAEIVGHALDNGVNFFDTANSYEGYARTFGSPGGVGEELLGKALSRRRHEAVVLTKLGNPIGHGPLDAGLSSRHLTDQLEKSLKRLQTDYVDILLCHRTDPSVATEDIWSTLDRFVRSGKVRAVGVSNWPAWRLAEVCELAEREGLPHCAVSSPEYSLMSRDVELEHISACMHYRVALVTYKGLKGGVLTGKYKRGQVPADDTRAGEGSYWVPPRDEALFDRLEKYNQIVERAGMSMTEYSLAWLLSRPMVTSLILGFRNTSQMDAAIAASSQVVPAEDAAQIDEIFNAPIRPGGDQVMRWRDGWVLEDREF